MLWRHAQIFSRLIAPKPSRCVSGISGLAWLRATHARLYRPDHGFPEVTVASRPAGSVRLLHVPADCSFQIPKAWSLNLAPTVPPHPSICVDLDTMATPVVPKTCKVVMSETIAKSLLLE